MPTANFHLPPGDGLGEDAVEMLSGVFEYTASSYKFLWTFAILNHVEKSDELIVSFNQLSETMFDHAIVPINRFKLNFGFYDRVEIYLREASGAFSFQEEIDAIYQKVLQKVPHRWLRPFFADKQIHNPTRKESNVRDAITQFAEEAFDGDNPPPYKLTEKSIELHPAWQDYLKRNIKIVRCWALWHWTNYLQNLNPNIPGIANKIGFPNSRGQWKGEREFWHAVIETAPQKPRCIYSGTVLGSQNFHLDHYVPWNFIGHNRAWNVIPATEEANEKKGDNLPHQNYFSDFVTLQNTAIDIWKRHFPTQFKPVVESYRVDLQLTQAQLIDPDKLKQALARTIPPIIETAKNNYFQSDWHYR